MDDSFAANTFMLVVWTWIVAYMLPFCNPLSSIVTLFPVTVIVVNILDSNKTTRETEKMMFRGNSVNVLLIVIGLFLGSKMMANNVDKRFGKWIILAVVFVMLSTVDVWVSGSRTKGFKYVRSLCEIFGVTVFIIIMLEYFVSSDDNTDPTRCNKAPVVEDMRSLE
jgi:hypothetical protein